MALSSPLIDVPKARQHLDDDQVRWIDCRFALQDTEYGARAYVQGHVPGALYAHLDHDLSGPIIPGQTGRHPLPPVTDFEATLRAWGIDDQTHVIAYDDACGVFASRLWWMLHWLGHERQSVLDGGLPRWTDAGCPMDREPASYAPGNFRAQANPALLMEAPAILEAVSAGRLALIDSRESERYQGIAEPMDSKAGHIPGAGNCPHVHCLDSEGRFLPPDQLRAVLRQAYGADSPHTTAVYCGSGVSACHTILASVQAGLGMPRLYAGSWSEWITDPSRPIAAGSTP